MRIEFCEATFKHVIAHYLKGLRLKKTEELYNSETIYDHSTGKIIFKLYLQEKKSK